VNDSVETAGNPTSTPASTPAGTSQQLRVDASAVKSSYCNVCNVSTTREEVVLNFGVNHDWERARGGDVELLHRIIVSPQAAKQVATLLSRVMQDFEARYGALS
jgi:hypothetical protein